MPGHGLPVKSVKGEGSVLPATNEEDHERLFPRVPDQFPQRFAEGRAIASGPSARNGKVPVMSDTAKLLYSKREFCAAHSISRSTFHRLVAAGRLKTIKIGRKTLIAAEAAAEFRHSLPMGG